MIFPTHGPLKRPLRVLQMKPARIDLAPLIAIGLATERNVPATKSDDSYFVIDSMRDLAINSSYLRRLTRSLFIRYSVKHVATLRKIMTHLIYARPARCKTQCRNMLNALTCRWIGTFFTGVLISWIRVSHTLTALILDSGDTYSRETSYSRAIPPILPSSPSLLS